MRPVLIGMQAFGPYPKQEVVDFRELGDHTLFLISGPTGAGKTMVLDAMCFALFGEPAGSDRGVSQLRSDFAEAETATEVTFDFTLGSKAYRVTRSPSWERPKKRGEGTTSQPAEATLWARSITAEDSEEGEVLETGSSKVTQRVEDIVGFKAGQFRQVVVIPQGEYRKLLSAKAEERESILRALFGTRRYGVLERKLKERLKALKGAAHDMEVRRGDLEIQDSEQLAARVTVVTAEVKALDKQSQALKLEATKAQEAHRAGEVVNKRFEELKSAQADASAVEKERETVALLRKELERAERATGVETVAAHHAERAEELRVAVEEREEAAGNLAAAGKDKEVSEAAVKKVAQRDMERKEISEKVTLMESRKGDVDELGKAQGSLKSAKKRVADEQASFGKLEVALGQAVEIADASRRVEVGALAQSLSKGEPCPVCGSKNHPEPAQAHEESSSAEGFEEAERQRRGAVEALEGQGRKVQEAQTALTQFETIVATLANGLPEDLRSPGALDAALEKARGELEALDLAKTEAAELDKGADMALAASKAEEKAAIKTEGAAVKKQAQAAGELERVLREADFKDVEDFQGALRDTEERASLNERVSGWDEASVSSKSRLSLAEKATQDLRAPAMEVLAEKAEEAEEAHDLSIQKHTTACEELKRLKENEEKLKKIDAESLKVGAKLEVVQRLSRAAEGKGASKMSFERFVLASLLEDVLESANRRFKRMSSGRYALRRAGEVGDSRKRGGLDLEIMDAYTGHPRSVSTLSGGESFEASLALALGMADTVQSRSGGLHMDSIFVDEGFGSLGVEDLDAVLGALEELQTGGRLVGVISHVTELAERIHARLEVSKNKVGSDARFIFR